MTICAIPPTEPSLSCPLSDDKPAGRIRQLVSARIPFKRPRTPFEMIPLSPERLSFSLYSLPCTMLCSSSLLCSANTCAWTRREAGPIPAVLSCGWLCAQNRSLCCKRHRALADFACLAFDNLRRGTACREKFLRIWLRLWSAISRIQSISYFTACIVRLACYSAKSIVGPLAIPLSSRWLRVAGIRLLVSGILLQRRLGESPAAATSIR